MNENVTIIDSEEELCEAEIVMLARRVCAVTVDGLILLPGAFEVVRPGSLATLGRALERIR
jgi:hypothetical protein